MPPVSACGPHPIWPKKPRANNIRGERPGLVGTDSAKAPIMGRLRSARPGKPLSSHFPAYRQQTYFEQLLGEALITTYGKGPEDMSWDDAARHSCTMIYSSCWLWILAFETV